MPSVSSLKVLRNAVLVAMTMAAAFSATAIDLLVTKTDGSRHRFTLYDGLAINLHDETLSITSPGKPDSEDFQIPEVRSLSYDLISGVNAVADSGPAIRLFPGRIEISAVGTGNLCRLYRPDGSVVAENISATTTTVINTVSLSEGIYILSINGNKGLKIAIR